MEYINLWNTSKSAQKLKGIKADNMNQLSGDPNITDNT